jgi:ferredoxin
MAYQITDECTACGVCVPECTEGAITEGDPIYIIDPGKCTECGSCIEVCAFDAIHPA